MRRLLGSILVFVLALCTSVTAAEKEIEIQGRRMISQRPPFVLALPADFRWAHSSTAEFPNESSITRAYFLTRERSGQVEEMVIVQVADKTDPMAGSMAVPPLKPESENRTYLSGSVKKDSTGVDYLIQLIAWNPNAPSLQPLSKKGIKIPSHLALQGQLLFSYSGVHAVLVKYSRDVNSLGSNVSGRVDDWNRGSISGGEKNVKQAFEKDFMRMIETLTFKKP